MKNDARGVGMNAVEFVRNQINEHGLDAGWDKAKAHIDYLISYGSEFGHVSKEEVEELEHLIKSWELVEYEGGLIKAKNVLFLKRALGLTPHADRLEKAIVDMESVGGGV